METSPSATTLHRRHCRPQLARPETATPRGRCARRADNIAPWASVGTVLKAEVEGQTWGSKTERMCVCVCVCMRVCVYRVAECRADGSWYGRGPGQASAVPRRPPGGPPEFTLRQPPRFYSGSAQSDTHAQSHAQKL